MTRTAARPTQQSRFLLAFVAAELFLAMAIPFLAIQGYHTLLGSRAGSFVEEPTRTDPGWRALVDYTPIVGVAEVDQGQVTGVALLVHHLEIGSAATVVLVPGTLELDGTLLNALAPERAVEAVGLALKLRIDRIEVVDQTTWADTLGSHTYRLDSPDPVEDGAGGLLFPVGEVVVGAENVSAFLGRPAPGAAPVSVQFRRQLFWNAVIADAPGTSSSLAGDLRDMTDAVVQVVDLPVAQLEPVALLDPQAAEALVRDVVAYPAGAAFGDRTQVRILDRTGSAGLEGIAAAVAAQGMEVIEIGNTLPFDDGETQVIVPIALVGEGGVMPAGIDALSSSVGSSKVIIDDEAVDDLVVTVVIGHNFDLENLY